jgi:predicted enzyme related to lactoylglutathione lyase
MVEGIGGAFIYADDAATLAAWYRDVLGLEFEDYGPGVYGHSFPVREPVGRGRVTQTVWSIFQLDSGERRAPQSFRVNYRVDSLDAMLDRIRARGIEIEKREDTDYGNFAWLSDPEGNKVELWEDTQMDEADARPPEA